MNLSGIKYKMTSSRPAWLYSVIVVVALIGSFGLLSSQPQTEPDLDVKVESFEPAGQVGPQTNFTIEFNRDLVNETELDSAVLDPPLEFEPPLSGLARWIDTDMLRFFPDRELAPATDYRVRVRSDKAWRYGNRIGEKRTFTFSTPPLAIESVDHWQISSSENPGMVQLHINLRFNYEIDPAQLAQHLEIKGDKDCVKSVLEWNLEDSYVEGQSGHGFYADRGHNVHISTESFELTDRAQIYLLKIDDNLGCLGCGNQLDEDFEKRLEVERRRRLTVREARPRYHGTRGVIAIRFSQKVLQDDAEQHIVIEPETDYRIKQHYYEIQLSGDFKPGQTYTINVDKGLPAENGALLENEFSTRITMPDYPPAVNFTSQGIYLPAKNNGLLEIETINIEKLAIEIEQYFPNNLVYALGDRPYQLRSNRTSNLQTLGRKFFESTERLYGQHNRMLQTTIDIAEVIGDKARGVFKISVRKKEDRWVSDTRLVMMTDLGIMARMSDDYLMVWVNSLSETKPVKKADVYLISRNNQQLLKGRTDSRGIAIFEETSAQIEGFDPFLIVVSKDDDMSFMKFSDCLLPTEDFDTRGRPYLSDGYEAFTYLNRDIFRPGDTAHIVTLIRDEKGERPDDFPCFLTIYDPSGREFKNFRFDTEDTDFREFELILPEFAPTGRYEAVTHVGDEMVLGRAGFAVEEFMPERISVEISSNREAYKGGDRIQAEVVSEFLFGPPAAGHSVSGQIILEAHQFEPNGWSRYSFTDKGRSFARVTHNFPESILDDTGAHKFSYSVSDNYTPPSLIKGLISASVREQGGRAVNAYKEITILPYNRFIGLKADFEGFVEPGQKADFSAVCLNYDGHKAGCDSLLIILYYLRYNSVLKQDSDGGYRYVSEEQAEAVDSFYVAMTESEASFSLTAPDYGHYRLTAEDLNGGHRSSISFYSSGWGYAPWSMKDPDRLEIGLDREYYQAGDKAEVQIRSPFGGRLLVTVERKEVLDFITFDMEENTAEISLPIKKDYFPTAYITATVIKPAGEIEKTAPARAFGIAPIEISAENKALAVRLQTPEIIQPRQSVQVDLNISPPGVSRVTVSATDVGILQLTDYHTPDPLAFFYGKRKLHLRPYDIYSLVYPELQPAESHLTPAGDRMMFEMAQRRHLNPFAAKRVTPVALWSGIVTTDQNGQASIEFDVPQFNGQLRLSAVAVRDQLYGSATEEMTVRNDIIIMESFPRFVSPGDRFKGLVSIFNHTGNAGRIEVSLDTDGPVEALSATSQSVYLDDGFEGSAVFELKAGQQTGKIKIQVSADKDTSNSQNNFELSNRPARPPQTFSGSGRIGSDSTVEFTIPTNLVEGTDSYVIQTSSLAEMQFSGQLKFLLRYPYGCLEQTVSRLFPMLYFGELARFTIPDLIGSRGNDYFINEGILKISGMIRPDGSFSFWPGGEEVNLWTSVYATHFLVEARQRGYRIDSKVYDHALDQIENLVYGSRASERVLPVKVYAGYVLALSGRHGNKLRNRLDDIPIDDLPGYSRYMLASTFHLVGDEDKSLRLIPTMIQPPVFERQSGDNLSSPLRSTAIMLETMNRINPDHPACAALAQKLIDASRENSFYTTHETAFALLALGKYLAGQEVPEYIGTLEIEGDTTYTFDSKRFKLSRNDLDNKAIKIEIEGHGPCFYYWQASGLPEDRPAEEYSRGIEIKRQYFDQSGNQLDLDSVVLGERIVCKLTARAVSGPLDNVVINDMLPAGLEIENPRIKSGPGFSWIPGQQQKYDYLDIRDDRLLIFTDLSKEKTFEYYYTLRAVSKGEFTIPPVMSECMYDPLKSAASSSGAIHIK